MRSADRSSIGEEKGHVGSPDLSEQEVSHVPEVSVVVQLRVEVDERTDPISFERAVLAEAQRAGRQLYREAVASLDRGLAAQAGSRQRLEPRWVATLVGRVRISRWRVKADGRTYHPLDRAIGLGRNEASAGLRETICDLALRLPYRQVAEVASRLTGEPLSHQGAWRVLQAEGIRVRDEESALVASVFDLGEAPPHVPAPELVVVEADGTYLRAQREPSTRFEVKTGVFYTAKEPAGGRRHRRFRLLDKGCYATTADADRFGRGLAARGFAWVGLHRARHVLCVHDGLDDYGQTFRDWFPRAVHQIDHFHLAERLWHACGADPARFARLRVIAFSDPVGLARDVGRRFPGLDPEHRAELASYLRTVAPDLHGIDRLPEGLRRGPMRIVGSGVVEKHQDLLVGRRMKGRGMRWTRRGADNLLALQARRLSDRWPSAWGVVAA